MVYTYGPCAACVKHKFASRITKKHILEVTVIIAGFCVLTNQILVANLA